MKSIIALSMLRIGSAVAAQTIYAEFQEQSAECAGLDGTCNAATSSNNSANNTIQSNYTVLGETIENYNASNVKSGNGEEHPFQCSIYMAPSSIPNAGFGLYTIRDIKAREALLPFTDAPSIPVCDEYAKGDLELHHWNHGDYLWGGTGLAEFECENVSESVVTFGSMCNYHTYLANVIPQNAKYDDTIGGGRFSNPGAGAFSYHTGHDFHAELDINAGQEIFCDYGETWLDTREGTFADHVPREDDFNKGAAALKSIHRNLIKKDIEFEASDEILGLVKSIASKHNDRIASTLPNTMEALGEIVEKIKTRGSDSIEDIAKFLAENTIEKRDTSWILENGICMENIKPGISNIEHAGRGAFAQNHIAMGAIVSPGPLLNIVDKDLLNMYEYNEEEAHFELFTKQLLLNYCFGHVDSKLLLCPQSNMILINHKSCRNTNGECGNNGPNARVQWGTTWDKDTKDWLELSMEEIEFNTAEKRRGLSLEVVATRDILPGEEITMDYGPAWEVAWEEHLVLWEVFFDEIDDGRYIPVRTLTDNQDFRTVDELEDDPYPTNVLMVCYYPEGFEDEESYSEEEWWSGENIAPVNGMDASYDLYPCEITKKSEDPGTVSVRIYPAYDSEKYVQLYDYDMKSISFRMAPYTSDVHLEGTFRHLIEIPDDIFPEQWKEAIQ
mmetsp:Transcript_4976/g.7341  ORF Transcript_4976/g.7341 Transcript_4976/m.7341 type:complete len:671 (-) Transcript_4976:204-2216(-)